MREWRHASCTKRTGWLAAVRGTERHKEVQRDGGRPVGGDRIQRLRRVMLASAIVVTAFLVCWVAGGVARFWGEGRWLAVVVGVVLGAAAIDVITGVVHWACDRFGDASTPIVGPLLIRAFREHHDDPQSIVEHDWVETNGEPCVVTALALIGLTLIEPHAHSSSAAFAVTAVWTMAILGGSANQAHKWAHTPRAPRFVRSLQRAGLTLSPERHARHHQGPHDEAYCISTGWMNPLLDRLGIWSRLERSLKGTT